MLKRYLLSNVFRRPEAEAGSEAAAGADAAAVAAAAAAEAAKPEAKAGDQKDVKPADKGEQQPERRSEGQVFQDRIGELTRLRRDAERQAVSEKTRADKLAADLAAAEELLASVRTPAKAGEEKPAATARAAAPRTVEEMLADPEVQRALDARADAKLTAAEIQRKGDELYDRGVEKFGAAKFDKALANFKAFDGLRVELARALMQVPNGEAVLYEIGGKVSEIERIYKLEPIAMAVEVAKLSSKLAATGGKEISKAPEPPEGVEGRSNGAGGKVSWDDPNASMDDFVKGREEHLKKKGMRL